ncbi:MAG: anaerobic ribonucleoside-triphosphate reductase activating protein [Candidatus Nealsonbacteria bacterium RIFCSPLOWO2_12_FULL_39_31]|uniref:Anaerobic ribonucleoside-triphosphate reductase activating protein n=3 Tax=Candidatus Nealsoniibacteriota TaxID=1817911 RepID=A0A1G2ELD8_9BACT|nr:MAG: Anaerobic ribonucleoside-triphosphate reductase activating protein [Parcubacteria group bacterium GW2011_GWA2_38_27]KKQ98350.1 MAG: Anaerobic ribonucleoside-triphosphate reductase activating protein [Parcubacteria group bacterium GW2011_GWC2_39_11]OGZ19733.1 MAG: anaerobic ribonucleoside-triphosphate reductase activating protein [Candidatus Nealsonbacteria bacterium RIFCSPHIGHO2_01_FULL_38_55]OGZ21040.1 MAG: anaerobic ribonucleoside-triphosphate reductase activating protein [Candidatus N
MIIGGLQKLTLIDFPDRLAATVFLAGCSFRCPWCYSSELVLPEKIGKHPTISEKEFFDFLKEKQGLLDGVVICGGEPTTDNNLPDFAKKIKEFGYAIKLDTNGTNPAMLENLIDKILVDYIAMDIKAPFAAKFEILNPKFGISNYERAVGVKVDLEKIRKSVKIIKNSGIDYEFRSTVVPGIHTKEDIIQIAKDISPAKKYYLQNFRPEKTLDPKFEKIRPYRREYLLEIQKAISPFFDICRIR